MDDFGMGYALGQDSNGGGNSGGMWGGDGSWIFAFLIIALIFGGNGLGGLGNNGANGAGMQGALTRGDLCSEFSFNDLQGAVRGVNQGLCDGFYAMNTGMLNGFNTLGMSVMQGFHGVDNAVCQLGYQNAQLINGVNMNMMQGFNGVTAGLNSLSTQLASCCCETQRAIDGVNYNMATNTCALQNTMNNNTRDIIDNANANSRAILDYLCQDKISTLQNENQALRLAASQSAQNATLIAAMDANKADILRRTGAECPTPAYVVQPPTPVNFPTNCCGQFNGWNSGGCNGGCGC